MRRKKPARQTDMAGCNNTSCPIRSICYKYMSRTTSARKHFKPDDSGCCEDQELIFDIENFGPVSEVDKLVKSIKQ